LVFFIKDKNPVDNIFFYNSNEDEEPFHFDKDNISLLIPQHYQERIIRIYVKDIKNYDNAKIAFQNYLKKFNLSLSPFKKF
jgi:deoxynucleoside triphosphate triphosphohydrolase SAMHD1